MSFWILFFKSSLLVRVFLLKIKIINIHGYYKKLYIKSCRLVQLFPMLCTLLRFCERWCPEGFSFLSSVQIWSDSRLFVLFFSLAVFCLCGFSAQSCASGLSLLECLVVEPRLQKFFEMLSCQLSMPKGRDFPWLPMHCIPWVWWHVFPHLLRIAVTFLIPTLFHAETLPTLIFGRNTLFVDVFN